MSKSDFVDLKSKEFYDNKFNQSLKRLNDEDQAKVLKSKAEVDAVFNRFSSELDEEANIEARFRQASGLHHEKAKEVIETLRSKPIGQIVKVYDKLWVLTPFNTVVEAQVYLNHLQDALTCDSLEILRIRNLIQQFTRLTFFDLIKLLAKKLLRRI